MTVEQLLLDKDNYIEYLKRHNYELESALDDEIKRVEELELLLDDEIIENERLSELLSYYEMSDTEIEKAIDEETMSDDEVAMLLTEVLLHGFDKVMTGEISTEQFSDLLGVIVSETA